MFRPVLLITLWVLCNSVMAADGKAVLQKSCVACHDLTGPAAASVDDLMKRKGPDLFYAGQKYRKQWLEQWLQQPRRLRPAGFLYFNHIKPGKESDEIDLASLSDHVSLKADEAKAVTEALMKLTWKQAPVKKGDFQGVTISASFGEMVFDKFNGCLACHRIEPEYGGVSGPEVYTMGQRLQDDYMVSFIRDPLAWNPKSPMPRRQIAEANIQKLVGFIKALSGGDKK